MPTREPRTLSDAINSALANEDVWPAVSWDSDRRSVFVVLRHHDGEQEWAVAFRLAPVGAHAGEWRPVEFTVQQIDPAAVSAMTGRTIRSLPIGELLAAARRAASGKRDRGPRPRPSRLTRPSEVHLAAFLQDRRGKTERGDEAYAGLALEYALLVEDGDRTPAKTLAAKHGGSAGTWANRIAEARRRGLLTPVKAGEAGGALTDKALKLLGAVDEQEVDSHRGVAPARTGTNRPSAGSDR